MSNVNFLMVCVEWGPGGLRTAQNFGRQFQLPPSVVNGYIESKDELPTFGQLGCQGFIVLGPHGEFAVQRTVPCYLESGTKAFQAVETLLATLWNVRAESAPPAEPLGSAVRSAPAAEAEGRTEDPPQVRLVLPAVGEPEMDEEHQALHRAVEELQQARTQRALQDLLLMWREHSQHEEQLFEKFDFGRHRSAAPGQAATAPHCQHHAFITSMMERAASAACCGGTLPCDVIESLVTEIQRHAELYDAAYAGRLGVEDIGE